MKATFLSLLILRVILGHTGSDGSIAFTLMRCGNGAWQQELQLESAG